jgi:transposase
MSDSLPSVSSEREYAGFAAIDWADQKNFWRLRPAGSHREEHGELENTPEAVEVWAASLYERFGGRPIAICLEQSRGALVYMLIKYPHLVLFPVHPTTAARYRETFCTSGAKDDPSDTTSLLDLLMRHRERLRPLEPDTTETRLLQFLVEERRTMVDEKTRQNNRLIDCLKITARIAAIYQAVPATRDAAVCEGARIMARGLVAVIATLRNNIAELDRRIGEVVATHPETSLFDSLPGAGKALVPRLIVAFGTRRERFASAGEMQRYSGIAPVTKASGNSRQVFFRHACPKFLRQTFHEFALHSIGQSQWAKAYYLHLQNDEKKGHHAAVRSLAYKWIRIIYRCWKDGKPYDEQIYLQSLSRRGSLLGRALAAATSAGWKSVAGFQKLSQNNA